MGTQTKLRRVPRIPWDRKTAVRVLAMLVLAVVFSFAATSFQPGASYADEAAEAVEPTEIHASDPPHLSEESLANTAMFHESVGEAWNGVWDEIMKLWNAAWPILTPFAMIMIGIAAFKLVAATTPEQAKKARAWIACVLSGYAFYYIGAALIAEIIRAFS